MKKRQYSPKIRRRPVRRYRRPSVFQPPEPPIVAGKFKGKVLSELSNDDLVYFLEQDAEFQTRPE